MKKAIAMILVLALLWAMAGCSQVTRLEIEDPAKILVEKEGGAFSVTLTDADTVRRITDFVNQLPLQSAQATEDAWTYHIQWLDENGGEIADITIAGAQIRYDGGTYTLGVGVDITKLTDFLETIPTGTEQ